MRQKSITRETKRRKKQNDKGEETLEENKDVEM